MKRFFHLSICLCLEFKASRFVKVKAHKRCIRGKSVKVRSYFRRVRRR